MAIATREQVMNALFAVLRNSCGTTFRTYSRRFMTWEAVVQSYQQGQSLPQPALFLYDGVGFGGGIDKIEQRGRGTPAVVRMYRTIVVYAQMPGGGAPYGPDATTPGGTVFHPLLEAVLNALDSDDLSAGVLTLGGLVSHVYALGEAMIVTGEIDPVNGQGMLTIPLEIMLYPSV